MRALRQGGSWNPPKSGARFLALGGSWRPLEALGGFWRFLEALENWRVLVLEALGGGGPWRPARPSIFRPSKTILLEVGIEGVALNPNRKVIRVVACDVSQRGGSVEESPVSMASWATSMKFAGRRTCRHPQIPGSGVALSAHGYSALRRKTPLTLNPKPLKKALAAKT